MSTSAVNASSLPSSSLVISTSGWPRTNTSDSSTARPYSSGSASLTASCRTVPRPTYWSIRRGRPLAGPETLDPHLLGECLVRLLEARRELVERHLDGELHPGGGQLLDIGLHWDRSP